MSAPTSCPELVLWGATLRDWQAILNIAALIIGVPIFLWRTIPPFSSRIEAGRYNDAYEYIRSWRDLYAFARVCPWKLSFMLTAEFWTTTIWDKARLRFWTAWWWLRSHREEVDKPRGSYYERKRPEKPAKWKRPIRQTHIRVKDHKAKPFEEVKSEEDLEPGDIVFPWYRASTEYSDKDRLLLYMVAKDGTLRRVENGNVSLVRLEEWRLFWFKRVLREEEEQKPAA